MNACMIQYATREEEDAARQEWWETRGNRAKEHEAKEMKRKEQEKFHNEWWGLADSDQGSRGPGRNANS